MEKGKKDIYNISSSFIIHQDLLFYNLSFPKFITSKIIEIKIVCALVSGVKQKILFRDGIPRGNMHGDRLKAERQQLKSLGQTARKFLKYKYIV